MNGRRSTRRLPGVALALASLVVVASCSTTGEGSSIADPAVRGDGGDPQLVAVDDERQPPTFDLDLSGLDLSDIELAEDEPAGEDPALPPLANEADADHGRDNGGGLGEAPDNLDDMIDIPLALDPGSALACAAFELGRDAAMDGDIGFGVALAERVTTNGETIEDATIFDIATALADDVAVDVDDAERGLDRCLDLGYETAS